MGKFTFLKTDIDDLYLIKPSVFGDERGYFMETYNEEFIPYIKHLDGSPASFVQDNESRSVYGVLRGLHFQKNSPQGKLVRVTSGEIFDVAVDLRKNSATYGKWYGAVLSEENKLELYIPEGFAHGFVVLSESATVAYKCTSYYDKSDEGGVLYCDSDLGIDWHIPTSDIILSDKDARLPTLSNLNFAF